MASYKIERIADTHCHTGENPYWDPERGLFHWVDIPAGQVFRYDPATGRHALILQDSEAIGGFTKQADGTLLLFRVHDMASLAEDGTLRVIATIQDEGMERFNDVIADPEGRVFAGTIGKTPESGGLHRIERDGAAVLLWRGTGTSNGMAFSGDLNTMWWTCSTSKRIYQCDYDRATGELSNRRLFYQASPGEGIPDGLTIDVEGCLWSAQWDGYRVLRIDPQGRVIEDIRFPVAKVSSVIFGGENLDELYLTTAGGSPGADSEDGSIYRVKVGVRGMPQFHSRIGL